MATYVRRRARRRANKPGNLPQAEVNTRGPEPENAEERGADEAARFPNERDESTDQAPQQQRGVMKQAAADAQSGQQSTEARESATDIYYRKHEGKG